ncbi:helix-turn-helix domain-containing protein [Zhongshania aliphaticivorans]|nr:AraC family transcriptional regulator [Zhongshania aliphaticivorans]
MNTNSYIVATDKVIPAWLQPVAVLDLCAARGINPHALLQNTALFASDLPFTGRYLSLRQFQQLLLNANNLWPGSDFPFQLGHQLLQHGLGPVVTLVDSYTALTPLLSLLCNYSAIISPALTMRLVESTENKLLLMISPSAFERVDNIALVAAMTSLTSMITRFSGVGELRYFFSAREGAGRENFTAHLQGICCFSAPFDGVRIEIVNKESAAECQSLRGRVAIAECDALLSAPPYLSQRLRELFARQHGLQSDLAGCSEALGVSQATLKRRLREHGLSFQQQLDSFHLELALIELLLKQATVDDAAARLHFHDSSNFRRAFKRWTGLSPSLMKANFHDLMLPVLK